MGILFAYEPWIHPKLWPHFIVLVCPFVGYDPLFCEFITPDAHAMNAINKSGNIFQLLTLCSCIARRNIWVK